MGVPVIVAVPVLVGVAVAVPVEVGVGVEVAVGARAAVRSPRTSIPPIRTFGSPKLPSSCPYSAAVFAAAHH